jgi:hypothetical protein
MDDKLSSQQLTAICEFLHSLVTDVDAKIAFGLQQRAAIQASLKKGIMPNTYRTEWLLSTKAKIAALLAEEAAKFNEKYKFDRISHVDMLDALETTLLRFGSKR